MKTKPIIIGIIILIVLYLIIIVLSPILKKNDKIEKINYLRFTYTTGYHINAFVIYEINYVNGKYIASIKPTDVPDEETKEVELTKEQIKDIEDMLNKFDVLSWNGFRKTDKYVLDGDSFCLCLKYDKEKRVDASGYMMWPKNYREVRAYLDNLLGSLY